MSLRDQACYTLELQPSDADPAVLELLEVVGASKQPRYARVRESREGEAYSSALYDYLTAAKLASIGYETDKAKKRRLELHGPDEGVDLDFTGKLNFEWTIRFLGCKFRWTKEVYGKDYVCSMDRKPDPKVEICLARAPDKNEPGRVQILHYNIERFLNEITDLRGLETLLVLSFLCFVDHQDDRWRGGRPSVTTSSSSSSVEGKQLPAVPVSTKVSPPEPDHEPEDPNEIIVGLYTDMDGHIARACALLQDPKILFIVIRTRKAEAVQRALEASLGVKRWRHGECLPDLHQYVHEEDPNKAKEAMPKKGPKVINLDDPPKVTPARTNSKNKGSDWKAPQNIAIYLSKIELPELNPNRRRPSATHTPSHVSTSSSTTAPAPAPPLATKPSKTVKPNAQTSNGKNDEPAKLSKKPNKVFSNPFTSSSPSSTPASQSAAAPPPPKQSSGNSANSNSNASPPAMPGAWSGPTRPPPPDTSSRPPAPAISSGGGNGANVGGQKLSALQKLVQISRK